MWRDCIPVLCVIVLLFSFCSETLSQTNTDDLIPSTDETSGDNEDTTDIMTMDSTLGSGGDGLTDTNDIMTMTMDSTLGSGGDGLTDIMVTSMDDTQGSGGDGVATEESTTEEMDIMTEVSLSDMMNTTDLEMTTTMETLSSDNVESSSNAISSTDETDTFDSIGNTITFSDDSTQETKMSFELLFVTFLLLSIII